MCYHNIQNKNLFILILRVVWAVWSQDLFAVVLHWPSHTLRFSSSYGVFFFCLNFTSEKKEWIFYWQKESASIGKPVLICYSNPVEWTHLIRVLNLKLALQILHYIKLNNFLFPIHCIYFGFFFFPVWILERSGILGRWDLHWEVHPSRHEKRQQFLSWDNFN